MATSAYPPAARIALLVAALVAGCASEPAPRPLREGPVALVTARHPPEAAFNIYAQGKTAAAGSLAGEGAAGGAVAGALLPLGMGPVGIVGYPVIAPITTLLGLVVGGSLGAGYGALHGLPAEQAAQTRALSEQAMAEIDPHGEVARRLADKMRGRGIATRRVAGLGPTRRDESPDYSALTAEQRAVMEVTMERIGMAARKGEPPRVALEMRLRIRIVHLDGEGGDGTRILEWAGRPRTVDEWRAGGETLLADEFIHGYEQLAQYGVEILVIPPPPASR